MTLKLFIVICLVAISLLHLVLGAPSHIPRTEQELTKTFLEFLQQDKQLAAALDRSNSGIGGASSMFGERKKRDATDEVETTDDIDNIEGAKQESGFFDRAAKFVMEVLQRFLKWVNSDN